MSKTNRVRKGETAVVITTDKDKRGVFFGYTEDIGADPIQLRACRMCVYWHAEVQGVVGLAANGPTAKCRVSPAADAPKIPGVTAVFEATPEAVEAWEAQPWG